jgi:hypothetical protein
MRKPERPDKVMKNNSPEKTTMQLTQGDKSVPVGAE